MGCVAKAVVPKITFINSIGITINMKSMGGIMTLMEEAQVIETMVWISYTNCPHGKVPLYNARINIEINSRV